MYKPKMYKLSEIVAMIEDGTLVELDKVFSYKDGESRPEYVISEGGLKSLYEYKAMWLDASSIDRVYRVPNLESKTIELTYNQLEILRDLLTLRTSKDVGFLLPKAKSISGIADVQDCGVPSPLHRQCI
ncbi:hypothetical protein LC087_19300 (plasmid) [Bacillus carboniphilus]|uniref:Uncharacterized protein n=1 Tax=Bacillus carboniphilus TaxID=86663 RepID=A0ABY9JYT3_9BACI|nr:hypothetical protein [Bacillus carboniphilus]WLR44515.1 hypothetical protein LC087_19300 [Bacillus carboniphilus]